MPKNVLVLNDSQGSLTPLIESLAQSGYTPYSTDHSEQCLGLFGEINAKTLLLSLQAKEALDPLPQIRQDPDGATIPILFFGTGAEEVTGNSDAHRKGGDCYFEHPINIDEVVKKIRSFVGSGEERPVRIPGAPASSPQLPAPLQLDSIPLPSQATSLPGNEHLATAASALLDRIYHKETIDGEAKTAAECQRSTLETELLKRKEATEARLAQLRASITEAAAVTTVVKPTPAPPSQAERELRARLEKLEHENFEATTLHQLEQERRQSLENQLLHAEESHLHLTEQVSELSSALTLSEGEKEKTQETLQATEQRLSSQLIEQSQELEEVREQTQRRVQENKDLQLALAETQAEQSRPPAPAPSPVEAPVAETPPPSNAAPQVPPASEPPATTPPSPAPRPQRLIPELTDAPITEHNAIPELFFNAFETRYTGCVEFTRDQDHKTVYFEAGKPVDAYSNLPEDQLEARLYRAGKLDDAPSQTPPTPKNKSARLISSELVTKGQLKPEELFTTAHDHLTELLYSLFGWESGEYTLRETSAEPGNHTSLSVRPPALLMEGIRRKYLLPRMISVVGPPGTVPEPRPDFEALGEQLQLTPGEKRLLSLIDGVRPIEGLAFTTGLPSLNVYQVLTGLLTTSAIGVRAPETEASTPKEDPTSEAIDKKRVQKKFKQIHSGDYFEIFGLNRNATPHEIERAFERLINDFSEEELAPAVSSQFTRELGEIRQVLDDAKFVLLNPQTRQSYSRNL